MEITLTTGFPGTHWQWGKDYPLSVSSRMKMRGNNTAEVLLSLLDRSHITSLLSHVALGTARISMVFTIEFWRFPKCHEGPWHHFWVFTWKWRQSISNTFISLAPTAQTAPGVWECRSVICHAPVLLRQALLMTGSLSHAISSLRHRPILDILQANHVILPQQSGLYTLPRQPTNQETPKKAHIQLAPPDDLELLQDPC